MEKNNTTAKPSGAERKLLLIISVIFVSVFMGAWTYSMNLRKMIVARNSVVSVDSRALVGVEQLRNMLESQISDSLTFFLMGSSSLFEELKKDKVTTSTALTNFEKQYKLAGVPEIIKRIEALRLQQQEFFDQGMEFRAKQTESKIVGQFYRAKTNPIHTNINKALDEIQAVVNADFVRAQSQLKVGTEDLEAQIPLGMLYLTVFISALFLLMVAMILRVLAGRARQLAERTRLYEAAKEANHVRDGILSAVAQDFNEPIGIITETTQIMKTSIDLPQIIDGVAVIDTCVAAIEDRIKDIFDQTRADMGNMTLRVEQAGLDKIMDESRQMLEPLAKQKDVRLEFNAVNPPVLAFLDRERVLRVLSNLVGNAIKFSPKQSKVIVKVRSDAQFVYVSVRDSGPGIPEKHLAEVFNRFWQARKTADQGPGVGLAVVKTIIEAHSGVVTVESHVGHGSTFTFSLPRRRPTGAQMKKPPAPIVRLGARAEQQAAPRSEANH